MPAQRKHGFALSFIVTGLGLILLPLARDVKEACAAVTVRGIGFGLFWLTIHTYELKVAAGLIAAGTLIPPRWPKCSLWLGKTRSMHHSTQALPTTACDARGRQSGRLPS